MGLLEKAFRLGESHDLESRKRALDIYRKIVTQDPTYFVAWYNLGVIESRLGNWQSANKSFSEAQRAPKLEIAAVFARLKILAENGQTMPDTELPSEFRGDNRGALGVQGPCHNAANELRNRGYDCKIEAKGESCEIISKVGSVKYTILLADMLGELFRNIFREEQGKSVNLIGEEILTELDQFFLYLDIGRMPLVQAPIND